MTLAYGHQPRIAYGRDLDVMSPLLIHQPEVSQAFYGILEGKPDHYLIDMPWRFNLNLQILKPDFETDMFQVIV